MPPGAIVRTFLLAVVAVVACGWAIVRYVTHPREKMIVPIPSASPSASSSDDTHEVPVPDLVPIGE